MNQNIVLDAWAIVALLQGEEPAASRVKQLLQQPDPTIYLSAINLGEVYYIIARKQGLPAANKHIQVIEQLPVSIIYPDRQRVITAAGLKAQHKLSYADAFAAGTAVEFNATLLTGDPELINLHGIIQIEALSRRKK